MYKPAISLVQEQSELFHRLQQIFEVDRAAREAIEKQRQEEIKRNQEEERNEARELDLAKYKFSGMTPSFLRLQRVMSDLAFLAYLFCFCVI